MLKGIVVLNNQVLYDNLKDVPAGIRNNAVDHGASKKVHRYTVPENIVRDHHADLVAAGKPGIIGVV